MSNIIIEAIILSIITILLFVIFVNSKLTLDDQENKRRRYYKALILSIIIWIITIFVTDYYASNLLISLWASRLSFTTSVLIFFFYYQFFEAYTTKKTKRNDIKKFVIALMTFLWVIISLTPLILDHVEFYNGVLKSTNGIMHIPFAVYTMAIFIITLIDFNIKIRKEKNKAIAEQMKYIWIGSLTSIVLTIVTNLAIPIFFKIEIRALGPFSLTAFLLFTYYAIVRYRFLNIKIVLSQIVYTFIIGVFPYSIFHLVYLAQTGIWGSIYTTEALISGYLISIIFIILLNRIGSTLSNIVNKTLLVN